MFDAQKLLGSLISDGLGGSRRKKRGGSALKWQLGLGAVGVAIAAWEHFDKSRAEGTQAAAGPAPGPPPPPPPSPAARAGAPAGAAAFASPPPPPTASVGADATADAGGADEAMLLVRAMICAAHADGHIDADEQVRILDRLVAAGLGSEERALLVRELAAPADPATLFADVRDPLLAEEIYVVSRLAITLDEVTEHAYLTRLAHRLGLTPTQVAELDLRCSQGAGDAR
jgi:uncharacterized membrane protein YebE (DUF533 family)